MKKKPFLSVVALTLNGYLLFLHVKSTLAPVIYFSQVKFFNGKRYCIISIHQNM
ncbi:hypothetical protein HanPSC8_Chr04g0180851 [Helianthus annuus]|nr:hypothetical protein HanPSC8_Chr04g0180851 [Helianthus annuus]